MPAISPAKLKLQTARLAEQYTQPGVFVREMHTLLKLYADHTHRPGQSGAPSALIESYNVHPPVMRQLNLTMKPIADRDPSGVLKICDALWAESFLEHRLLACMLLGQMPTSQAEPIIQRVESWTQAAPEQRLLHAVINLGMARMRLESPNTVLVLVEEWLQSSDISIQQLGLRALIPLVEEARFQNLPAVFRLLSSFLRNSPSQLRPDLIDLLKKLVDRSPNETAYILRTALSAQDNPDAAWLTRQLLAGFPKALQSSLRQAMKIAMNKG
jgi:hypothetical protein